MHRPHGVWYVWSAVCVVGATRYQWQGVGKYHPLDIPIPLGIPTLLDILTTRKGPGTRHKRRDLVPVIPTIPTL